MSVESTLLMQLTVNETPKENAWFAPNGNVLCDRNSFYSAGFKMVGGGGLKKCNES